MIAHGLESPYAERLAEWKPDPAHDARITTRVPCAEYFPVRDRALLAHATQIDPEGAWFACPLEVHQEAWPTEDYELARSLVSSDVPEDDLFAGVREQVETLGA
jgi:mycothiol S-conjugate amidase